LPKLLLLLALPSLVTLHANKKFTQSGIGADYISHTLCQAIAAFLATIGYLWMFFLPAPTGPLVYVAACMVGLGEIGMIVTSQLLVAAEAPKNVRCVFPLSENFWLTFRKGIRQRFFWSLRECEHIGLFQIRGLAF
jgi:hypothetical protein